MPDILFFIYMYEYYTPKQNKTKKLKKETKQNKNEASLQFFDK